MKKIIVLSLGTILITDFNLAVTAFTKSADLPPTQNPMDRLKELIPLFLHFNLGTFNKAGFKHEFLKILPLKEPDNFEDLWNSMCVINDSVRETAKLIAQVNHQYNDQLQFVIYSDTNPIHFDFIQSQLKDSGLDFSKMYVSYKYSARKETLLTKIIKDFKNDQFVVVVGNTDKIRDDYLKQMVEEKNKAVLNVTEEKLKEEQLTVVHLSGPQLTLDDINKLVIENTTSPVLKFSTVEKQPDSNKNEDNSNAKKSNYN